MSGETEEKPSGWTTDTALQHMQRQHDDLQRSLEEKLAALAIALDERYATQTKAIDAAKESQETAMKTAFDAADKAVQAALTSAEKAVTKAELASNDRFSAVNEFRAQLADQASRFMPRAEAESNSASAGQRLDDHIVRADAHLALIDAALSHGGGVIEGNLAQHTETRLNFGLLIAAATLLLGLIGTVITLIVVSHA